MAGVEVQIVPGVRQPKDKYQVGDKYPMGLFAEVIAKNEISSEASTAKGQEELTVCATNYLCDRCIAAGKAKEVGCYKAGDKNG